MLDLRGQVEGEGGAQLLGEVRVPTGVEGAGIADELADAHPAGQIGVLGDIAKAREHAGGISAWIAAKDADRALLRAEEAEDVFDESRLAGAVDADQSEDRPTRDAESDVVGRGLGSETASQSRNLDDCITGIRRN